MSGSAEFTGERFSDDEMLSMALRNLSEAERWAVSSGKTAEFLEALEALVSKLEENKE